MHPSPDQALAAADLVRRAGGEIESIVRGGSMAPTLPAGARIRIGPPAPGGYTVGAVVAFLAGGTLVGHRVVGRTRDLRGRYGLLTRGDAAVVCDPPVDPGLVVGEVTAWRDGSAWKALPPAPRRGPASGLAATLVLGCVRALATLDLPRASRLVEALLVLQRRLRAAASRLRPQRA